MTIKTPDSPSLETPEEKLSFYKRIRMRYLPNLPWKELAHGQRFAKVCFIASKLLLLFASIYLFFSNVGLLSAAFKILSGDKAKKFMSRATGPVSGPCAGLLITIVFQSSSSATSLVVGMVSSELLTVSQAIPIIMGANIGTSITSTIVTIGHIGNKDEFKLATEGATVHDFFNIILVLFFGPLEAIKFKNNMGFLEIVSNAMLSGIPEKGVKNVFPNFIKFATTSYTKAWLGSKKNGIKTDGLLTSLPKSWETGIAITIGLTMMILSLLFISKLMSGMLKNQSENLIKNSLLKNGIISIIVGIFVTVLVQSSSITTSTLVPLVASGFITLEQMFPLTLGANLGTTFTAIMAALSEKKRNALQIALCHFLFNLIGIILVYPIPYIRSAPIVCSRALGYQVKKRSYFGLLYVVFCFFVLPIVLFCLSLAKGGDIAGAVLIYTILLTMFVYRQIRLHAPQIIPKNFPNFMKPNDREEKEKAEKEKKKKEYINLMQKL